MSGQVRRVVGTWNRRTPRRGAGGWPRPHEWTLVVRPSPRAERLPLHVPGPVPPRPGGVVVGHVAREDEVRVQGGSDVVAEGVLGESTGVTPLPPECEFGPSSPEVVTVQDVWGVLPLPNETTPPRQRPPRAPILYDGEAVPRKDPCSGAGRSTYDRRRTRRVWVAEVLTSRLVPGPSEGGCFRWTSRREGRTWKVLLDT